MNLSHWGVIPGWFVPDRFGGTFARWEAIDFETYLVAVDAAEQAALDLAIAEREELRRRRNAFLN